MGDGHLSRMAVAGHLEQPTRGFPLPRYARGWDGRCGSHLAAYLALLRLGVALPPLLPTARWALTPPFHPYPGSGLSTETLGGLFSVALSVALRRPGVTWQSTRWSSDFPRAPRGTRDHHARPVAGR